jgi:hypothetical protein
VLIRKLKMVAFSFVGSLFLLSSLMPGFSEQVNKLPSLVNHYRHHLEEHGTVSISEFISLHYSDDSRHKQEEDHQDLPLFQISPSNIVALQQDFYVFQLEAPVAAPIELARVKHNLYSFRKPGGIFQPPKFA